MVVEWHEVLGLEVAVTFTAEDDAVWRAFQAKACGIAALPPLAPPLSTATDSSGHQEAATDSTAVATKRRHLSLPETYYAAAIDGLLPRHGSSSDLWERFARASPTFARQFAAYHHFRQLGWLLKPGLNYGAHYVLYRGSAAHFHSEYIVYVQDADGPLAWCTIQTLTRIAADVKKTVLVCDVTVASRSSPYLIGSADGDVKSDESISEEPGLTHGVYYFHDTQYTVEAVAIRFWDASFAAGLSTESLQPYAFQSQPVLLKKPKKTKKRNQTKRPERQQEVDTAANAARTKPSS